METGQLAGWVSISQPVGSHGWLVSGTLREGSVRSRLSQGGKDHFVAAKLVSHAADCVSLTQLVGLSTGRVWGRQNIPGFSCEREIYKGSGYILQ